LIALPSEKERAIASGNVCTENFEKIGHVVFEICEWTYIHTRRHTDTQTHRHTNTLIAPYFAPLPEAKQLPDLD